MSKKNYLKNAWIISIILATFVSIYFRIYYGWDQDESYVILLADKIAEGKKLFKDLWDLHQTSAMFTAIFCKLYTMINGSVEGIGIYLRYISIIIQCLVAFLTFRIINKITKKESAFLAAIVVANMLPRATQQFEYGTMTIWAVIVSNLLLLDAYYSDRLMYSKTIMSAIAYAISILAYPTMVISLPFYFYFFIKNKNHIKIKYSIIFIATCFILAVVFIVYLLSYMDIPEFMMTLKAIGDSGDHTSFFSAFLNISSLLKSLSRIFGTVFLAIGCSYMLSHFTKYHISVLYSYMIITTIIVIGLNLTGLRPSGPYGFLERYLAVVVLCFFIIKNDKKSSAIIPLFYVLGIVYFLGSLMGSNLGLNENAMFLEMAIIAVVIIAYNNANKLEQVAVSIFVIGIIFTSGYFVRVNYTEPANVTQCTEMIEKGPLKGISVKAEQKEEITNKANVVSLVSEKGKTYALLSNEPLYNYYIEGDTVAPRYVTTAKYNQQWIDYYDLFDHDLPDILFVDKYWYSDIQSFYSTVFGKWIKNKYDVSDTDRGEFWILSRKEDIP